jgi:hypothetical protein
MRLGVISISIGVYTIFFCTWVFEIHSNRWLFPARLELKSRRSHLPGTAQRFNVAVEEILHVGDDLESDYPRALSSGMRSRGSPVRLPPFSPVSQGRSQPEQ